MNQKQISKQYSFLNGKQINTKTLDWFPYKVKIRKAIFNKTNQIVEFKKEQIQPE